MILQVKSENVLPYMCVHVRAYACVGQGDGTVG